MLERLAETRPSLGLLTEGDQGPWLRVVGMLRDAVYVGHEQEHPMIGRIDTIRESEQAVMSHLCA